MKGLSAKRVLVTGAASGIGRAIAARLVEEGARVAALDERWGGLDGLANNAGISLRHAFLEATLDEWAAVLGTNLVGAFHVAQSAARRMHAAGSGAIVDTGSINGQVGCPNYAAYNASKAGVIELSRTMALELAPTVRVCCVCPGAIRTPMQEAEYGEADFAALDRALPAGRHGRPAEVAALVAFRLSDEAPFLTGEPLGIDGGETAGGLASRPAE